MPVQTVLLVDDDADIRTIAALSLARLGGMHVHVAESGARGLALAEALQPDLILLDVMMPGMDGEQALLQLRANAVTARIPVVFMTAKVMRQEIDRWMSLGACGVIQKPFDPISLPRLVQAAAESQGS